MGLKDEDVDPAAPPPTPNRSERAEPSEDSLVEPRPVPLAVDDGKGTAPLEELRQLRYQIDKLDERILWMLREREDVVVRIMAWKSARSLPLYDPEREKEILRRADERAEIMRSKVARGVFREILRGSVRMRHWFEKRERCRKSRS